MRRLTNEDKLIAIFQYSPLDQAEHSLRLAQSIVKQRVAAERGTTRKIRKAKTTGMVVAAGKQTSFDPEAL